jgi:hypothetical protein
MKFPYLKSKKEFNKNNSKIKFKINKSFLEMDIIKSKRPRRALIYTQKAKELISFFRKERIFKEILDMSVKISDISIFNPSIKKEVPGKFILIAKRFDNAVSFNCKKTYTIKFLEGPKGKYFIKEGNIHYTVFEHLALNYLEKLGFNVIKPVLSYSSNSRNFIVYEHTHLPTLYSLKRKINPKKYSSLIKKLNQIKEILSKESILKKQIIEKYPFIENFKIVDIREQNVFYDSKLDKLYLFDPILDFDVHKNKLPNKKYVSNY